MLPPRRLEEICERAQLNIAAIHSKKWAVELRRKWRDTFATPEVDWRNIRVEWDVLGTPLAPALERGAAIRKYDDLRFTATVAWVTSTLDYTEVFEVSGQLPSHSWWRQEIGASDLYIVESDWRWSFVMTHEEIGLGIGPYTVLPHASEAHDETAF